ncbi:MAG TPA: glycosyltransferase family 4 protein [Solirubrobacteraceae bacterium]|jgi:glycosyltransferase involved in cell wall biosynthesis
MDILITSSYYWPELTGNAPYVTGMAEYFAERHRVVVATAYPHYPQWEPQMKRRPRHVEHQNGVEIQRRFHYVPRSQSAAKRAVYEATMFAGGLTALRPGWRPDVILGVMPSLASSTHARVAARLHKRPYGLVFHDLMGEGARQSGVSGGGRVADIVTKAEIGLARGAKRIAVYADGMRRYFEDGGVPADKIDRVRPWTLNWNPTVDREEMRRRLGWNGEFICVHAGNMGHKQGLDNVLDAAAKAKDPDVRFVLAGDGNERARLQARAREMGLRNLLFIEPMPWGEYESMLMAADVLVVNQRPTVGEMSFPSKLTSYFPAGRPVVAAVAGDADTAAEVRRSEAGVVVDPSRPEDLAATIEDIKGSPDRGEALGAAGRHYAESVLSREAILREYDQFIARLAPGAGHGSG